MLDTTIFSRVRAATRRFAGANQGNIAVLFAIAAVPVISFVGAAIDYTRANAARSAMQAALDSTALMLGKDLTDGTITTSQISTQATNYFNALYRNADAKSVSITATYTAAAGNGSTILLAGSGMVNTDFMKVAGFPSLNFNTNSTAAWGNVRMRVAMALDNTGSMAQDGKIAALRTSAASLVDQLSALARNPGDVYISVVPFAKEVNVGSSNHTQSWIDWSLWDSNSLTNSWGTCSQASKTTRSSCQSAGKVWTPDRTKWTGCVTDRTPPYNSQDTAPTAGNVPTLFPADEYYENSQYYCKTGNNPPLQKLMPLSYDWTAIKATINAMQPTGGTNQPIGISWAWQSLQQTLPLSAPAEDSNYTYKHALIVLSDGLNTEDRWPAHGNGNTQYGGAIDAIQQTLCTNIKNSGVVVYAIQLNTGSPGDPTSTALQNCASSLDKFYLVRDASQTLSVFNSIGTSLAKLRVAK
ncbi:TadE/TadG family type IV pilus assembly protein [Afipia sp. GAS231]|uniref:TadE/TadG family type IV pilus assembly protein n=1 Tax=Afipia sp. GAS231 TaxID=1882747 RepID=UPI00087C967B|nr:TadE/TadG family type IV pilus assembly protein [Afipia sp. GAS231]SDN07600.1 Flp pilus assembly protein TadG [Afipia sp. GAS231]